MLKERDVHWVSQSSDKKIGKVMASYSPKESCPDSCSLKQGGCYAWGLFYLRKLGEDIKSGLRQRTFKDALKDMKKTAKIVRHRVAGDVVGDQKETLDECKMVEEQGLINIGYTHDWRSHETQILKEYFRASCQNIDEVYEAKQSGWASTVIVPKGTDNKIELKDGLTAIMCPVVREEKRIDDKVKEMNLSSKKEQIAEKSKLKKEIKINCNSCTLCKVNDKTRDIVVMFEVHGAAGTIKDAMKRIK